jgi:hypothetical protein
MRDLIASHRYGLILCLSLLPMPLLAKEGGARPMWVELGPGGQVIARHITPEATCPQINIDGNLADMTARAPQTLPGFPVISCEAVVPAGAEKVSILGQRLVLPVSDPKRLVIIGDTGCRIKAKHEPGEFKVQDCESGKKWPFRNLAKRAAEWAPELVIHVGDYIYREIACPYPEKCDSSPFGDNWGTWQADFFAPGAPLLAAAPWVMVRGNHEDCNRAGGGFFRFLETTVIERSSPVPPPCREYTNPYAVPIGALTLLILDSSAVKPLKPSESDDEEEEGEAEEQGTADESQLKIYTKQFSDLWGMAGAHNWLLMHHPLRAARSVKGGGEGFEPLTDTLWTAAGDVPASLDLAVTGHIHLTEALTFDGHPSQIVLGAGGTKLSKDVKARDVRGHTIGGWEVATAKFVDDFGYATVRKKGTNSWSLSVYGTDGARQMKCSIDKERVDCRKD